MLLIRHVAVLVLAVAALLLMGCRALPQTSSGTASAEQRAIEFLQREVPAWKRENGCYSCHNNGDAARGLFAARQLGHRVPAAALADTVKWLNQPGRWDDNQGDPGFSDQRLANLQFAVALLAGIESGHAGARAALGEAARRVAADQDADGSWPIDRQDRLGSPATYGPTLATFLAWRVLVAVQDAKLAPGVARAERWLGEATAGNVPAAAALLLAAGELPRGSPVTQRRDSWLDYLRRAQNRDGGWGPFPDSPAEPFDTALALLALDRVRAAPGVLEMIRRGREHLVSQQEADGGWPATTRPAGGTSYAQRTSTTAWATLALLATGEKR